MDTTQLLLVFIVVILTGMLGVIFTQIFFILREFRKTLEKTNQILDDTTILSKAISHPLETVTGLMGSFKQGSKFLKMLTNQSKKDDN